LIKNSEGNITQKKLPYIEPSYALTGNLLTLEVIVGYNGSSEISSTREIIDLASLKDINNRIIYRKIENFQNINKILKRDGEGMYTLSDFIRGRLGEIYAEIGTIRIFKNILPEYMEEYSRKYLKSYDVSIVEQIVSKRYVLQKRINALNHSNYLLIYNKPSGNIITKGEFDFVFQISYEYRNSKVSVLVVGESKTGNLHINPKRLTENLIALSRFPYDYIIYSIVIPQEIYFNKQKNIKSLISKNIKDLYYSILQNAKTRYKQVKFENKYYIVPIIFRVRNTDVSSFFKYLSGVVTDNILRLFKERNIEVVLKVDMNAHSPTYIDPKKCKPHFMIKIPLDVLIEDIKHMKSGSKEELLKKYGEHIHILISQ